MMAALGALLQSRGFSVRLKKLDPYLNVDPGTMNPIQHGECFVTDDGTETDLDLGHYERFTSTIATKQDSITSGQIYKSVLEKERRGDYLGQTVQVVPHVTGEIKDFICYKEGEVEFVLCEIGGTVGDIEGLPFLEATRQLRNDLGQERTMFIHTTLLPYLEASGELKTKPTQHSVRELLSLGIQADMLVCRSPDSFEDSLGSKISLYCNVPKDRVIEARDVSTIYGAPMMYHKAGLDQEVLKFFDVRSSDPDMTAWKDIEKRLNNPEGHVKVAIVGKYTELQDAYKSLDEALTHGGIANKVGVEKKWLDSAEFSEGSDDDYVRGILGSIDGIIIPGGFGSNGIEGKIRIAQYARENQIPFFGICLGMQVAIIDYARRCSGLTKANSREFGEGDFEPVIDFMKEWTAGDKSQTRNGEENIGGTMRLGSFPCLIQKDSLIHKIYEKNSINERHRHRYEVNGLYIDALREHGMNFSGMSPDGRLAEIVELNKGHPWYIGVQFHPELKSRPFSPHPLFKSFVGILKGRSKLI